MVSFVSPIPDYLKSIPDPTKWGNYAKYGLVAALAAIAAASGYYERSRAGGRHGEADPHTHPEQPSEAPLLANDLASQAKKTIDISWNSLSFTVTYTGAVLEESLVSLLPELFQKAQGKDWKFDEEFNIHPQNGPVPGYTFHKANARDVHVLESALTTKVLREFFPKPAEPSQAPGTPVIEVGQPAPDQAASASPPRTLPPPPSPHPSAPPPPSTPPAAEPSTWGPRNWLARKLLLPSSLRSKSEHEKLRRENEAVWGDASGVNPGGFPIATFKRMCNEVVISKDVSLHVIRYRNKLRLKNAAPASAIIYCNANLAIAEDTPCAPLLDSIKDAASDCDVISFDYRSTGGSKGKFRKASDLIADTTAVANWVHERLKVPKDAIHFVGHSLGGAVALKTKIQLGAEWCGTAVVDRTFSSVRRVAKSISRIAAWLLPKHLDLEITPEELGKSAGPVIVLQLEKENDTVISEEASLYRVAERVPPKAQCYRLTPIRVAESHKDLHSYPTNWLKVDGDDESRHAAAFIVNQLKLTRIGQRVAHRVDPSALPLLPLTPPISAFIAPS